MTHSFIPSPRSILSAFDQVEAGLNNFIEQVPMVPEHAAVWSPALVGCIFDACSQLDSLWKLRATTGTNTTIKDHFDNHAHPVSDEWLVLWDGIGCECNPFAEWKGRSQYTPLAWWQAYNSLKHNRWENIKQATLRNAVDAVSALFLAIATDPRLSDMLAERDWLHSEYAKSWTLNHIWSKPREFQGVTFESKLFSYALGSSDIDFSWRLACYRNCTHRFGRWLERKYKRQVIMS